jgi:hypothetical protein
MPIPPSIRGHKSAQRLAFQLLRAGRDDAGHLAQAILDVKDKLRLCCVCNHISGRELCIYFSDARRDPAIVRVVEEPHSIVGTETTRQFEGRYHVLHGALSPLRGIGLDAVKIRAWWSASGRARSGNPSSPPTRRWKPKPLRSTGAAAQAARHQSDSHRHGHSHGQRFGIRRRGEYFKGYGRPVGSVANSLFRPFRQYPMRQITTLR